MTEEEIKGKFIEAILDSVTEHGRARTSYIGALRAYDAIKSAGLLVGGSECSCNVWGLEEFEL